ncbi:MAG: Hypothetical protein AJITA_01108 [Acetilactobacillus jinshanensis]
MQKLAIINNIYHNGMNEKDNNDYSSLSFAILIVLILLFISFICLLINI